MKWIVFKLKVQLELVLTPHIVPARERIVYLVACIEYIESQGTHWL